MNSPKQIIAEIKDTAELKNLLGVYEEIAAARMQKIRTNILTSRQFFEELGQLSDEVGSDFSSFQVDPQKPDGTVAAVYVGANSGLYGNILDTTLREFLDYVTKNSVRIYLVGKLSLEKFKILAPSLGYRYIELPDDGVDLNKLGMFLSELLFYKKVVIFYGKFKNIAIQLPTFTKISGEILPKSEQRREFLKKKRLGYLYEPNMEVISEFFANEIFSVVLEQILHESQLAKYASRIMHLDESIGNISRRQTALAATRKKISKKMLDKKQNSTMCSIIIRGLQS